MNQPFKYYSSIEVPELPLTLLDWDEYTYRQRVHKVHSETKTIPLIWDEKLKGDIIYHKNYTHFKDFLDNLPLGQGYIQSAILINLPAGKSIPRHIDSAPFFKNYHRLHIPLITNEDCLFTVGSETKHLKQGEIWEINNDNAYHSVVNGGSSDRIHLLIDFYETRLLISTHNRLMLNDKVIHENEGVYYGAFKGEGNTVWVVSRGAKEYLLQIDLDYGLIFRKQIPSLFTHDCIRNGDKVYIADCGHGSVVILNYPSMEVYKVLSLFTVKEHINTLLYDKGILWCLLHNLGKSKLVGIDPETGEYQKIYTDVGIQSHGLVRYLDGFLVLSSFESQLLYVTDNFTEVLFTDCCKTFLKGLLKVGNLVYFGASPPLERRERGDPSLQCDLVSFDLVTGVVTRQSKLTMGLLNNLSLIHI